MTRLVSQAFRGRFVWAIWLLVGLVGLSASATSIYVLIIGTQVAGAMSVVQLFSYPLAITAWASVGGLILTRFPRHIIGRLLLALSIMLVWQYSTFLLPPALVELGRLDADAFIAQIFEWSGLWTWVIFVAIPSVFLPLYFPSGALPSERWRLVSLAGIIGVAANAVSLSVSPGEQEIYANPFVIPGGEVIANVLTAIGAPTMLFAILGSLASMAIRYRRAGFIERQQMKWLFYPLAMFTVWLIYDLVAPSISPQSIGQTGSEVAFTIITFVIPVAIGIAILRYRLYDIDVIIRKTLVYGLVTAALALVYYGSVVLMQQVAVGVSGGQSPLVIVISTLIIAALFSPLRRRVQELVDRRFFRAKYDKDQTLAAFARAARDETDLEALTTELVAVMQKTMQPRHVTLWLRPTRVPQPGRSPGERKSF